MAKVKLSKLQTAYREFFKALMDEYGVKSPVELKDKRSEFFNRIKKEWPAAKKKIKEGVLRQEIREIITEVLDEGFNDETFIADQLVNTWELSSPKEMVIHLMKQTKVNKNGLKKLVDDWYKNNKRRNNVLLLKEPIDNWIDEYI